MTRRLAPLPLLAVLCAARAWAQPCTPTLVTIDPDQTFEVPSATFDTTGGSGGTAYQISLDLVRGTLWSNMTSNEFGRIELEASDRFLIDGAPGTATVDAVLEVTAIRFDGCGLQCAWAMTRVEWRDESGGSVNYQADTRQAGVYHFEMTLPVVVTIGQPFTLTTVIETQVQGLGANLSARADVATRLRFDHVPDGARVRSCHGFDSMPVAPTRHATWGGLKARYR